ncbi:sodium/hydrogen exchanger family protein [Rhodopirellula maiorica SM1]|uniref:Sodium/hydrogen exchanger family protein n=1 Tax=Rhodopirellula maiorica SM1 TaxID=1265738 RepID=M5R9G5_9BACT|nr:sodium/hydrogen exchanger family protein [Rhodopirellula maiorica SM1]
MTHNLVGRQLFREGLTFSKIRELHESGAVFKATKLTESFSYTDFIRRYNEVPELLCVIQSDGVPLLNTVSDPLKPEPGQTIVCLVTSVPLPHEHEAMDTEKKTDIEPASPAADSSTSESSESETLETKKSKSR